MTKLKILPKFKSEDDERKFWATHSPLDYFDKSNARLVVFPYHNKSCSATIQK